MRSISIFVIGSGGREHALAWALAQSPQAGRIYVAPGNAGTEQRAPGTHPRTSNVPISADDIPALARFAREQAIGLTVVGPETPLAEGIVDAFQAAGLRIFGPTRAAAQLESSKAYAKRFMRECGIPTAEFAVFSDYAPACRHVEALAAPRTSDSGAAGLVVKADGLAAGKGVIVCDSAPQALAALKQIMVGREFGAAGDAVVVEERLSGPELSVLAFSDGRTVLPMPPARDHKRVFDGDQGPNTGGMGAYSPVPGASQELLDEVRRTVLQPAVDGLAARGVPYVGVLYAGLMLTPGGIKVLEFNCRFGDPETQAILPLLDQQGRGVSPDSPATLLDILLACVDGRLAEVVPRVTWHAGACAAVVLASPGYPGPYPKGLPSTGLDEAAALENTVVFQAGTAAAGGQVATAGGRVLAVSARDENLALALDRAYGAVEHIRFEGMHYRRDIGTDNRQHLTPDT